MEPLPDLDALARFDDRLRAVADDPAAVRRALAEARARIGDGGDPARLLGYAGNALRLLGEHEEAVAAHREALAAAPAGRAGLAARIRLGESLRCADDFAGAERELRAALEQAGAASPLRHFALQHLGKTLVDAGRREEAATVLAEALALREAKGDAALVESTRAALERAAS